MTRTYSSFVQSTVHPRYLQKPGQIQRFPNLPGRNVKSGLRHQGQQAECFQRNRFSARIRTGDDNRGIFPAELNIIRNDLIGGQKRMAGLNEADIAVRIDDRLNRLCRLRVFRFCEYKVKGLQDLDIVKSSSVCSAVLSVSMRKIRSISCFSFTFAWRSELFISTIT